MPSNFDVESIPAELKDSPRWVVWRWVEREGKRTKPPFNPATGRPGDATDPSLWLPFERALELSEAFEGVGYSVAGDSPYTGVDLDRSIDESGNLAPWAESIVRRLDSYTEVTPSGRGLRVWVRGKLPGTRRRKGLVEMYDRGRYFTVTGRRWPGTTHEIVDRAAELAALHAELFPLDDGTARGVAARSPRPLDLSDEDVLRKAFESRNGSKVEALFRGDTSGHGGDDSAADLALCSHLAFWFGGDDDAIDRVFRRSGLFREKWDRADYRQRTIAKALERTSFYDAKYRPAPATPRPVAPANVPAGEAGADDLGENVDDPHRLAKLFLNRPPVHPDGQTLVLWNEEWHRWNGAAWSFCPDMEIAAELTNFVKGEFDRHAEEFRSVPKRVTRSVIHNALQALRGLTLLTLRECPERPAWIGAREPGEDLPPPAEVLAASNTLVHLPSFVAGEPCMLPLSPRFFSPTSLGYDFMPAAPDPSAWLDFLRSLWPNDPESIEALQEWFGYLLTADTSQQKVLMVIGPKRSGKGTIGRVLKSLVGESNVTSPTLSSMSTNFGVSPLIGKTVALIADARLSGRADAQVIVERILSISGEDAQTIDRKHREAWTGRLTSRFVLFSNELPRLGDSSGALPSRMVLLRMTQSFYGKEDTQLFPKLSAERPGILLWAIAGWARLRERGRFVQPKSGLELLEDLYELSSPIASFVEERCRLAPDAECEVKDIYGAWKEFCAEKGRDHPGDEAGLGRNLRAHLPGLTTKQIKRGGRRSRVFVGIELIPVASF